MSQKDRGLDIRSLEETEERHEFLLFLRSLSESDGSDGEGKEVSKIDTSLELFSGSPVSFDSGDISLNGSLVEGEVLGDSLAEGGRVGEDLGPVFDSLELVTHALTSAEGLRDLEGNEGEVKCGLNVVVPARFLDVSDTGLDLVVHELTTLVARLDLNKLVVFGHAVHESSDEVGSGHDLSVDSDAFHFKVFSNK